MQEPEMLHRAIEKLTAENEARERIIVAACEAMNASPAPAGLLVDRIEYCVQELARRNETIDDLRNEVADYGLKLTHFRDRETASGVIAIVRDRDKAQDRLRAIENGPREQVGVTFALGTGGIVASICVAVGGAVGANWLIGAGGAVMFFANLYAVVASLRKRFV